MKAEPTGIVAWVLKGFWKEREAPPGVGAVKVERWVVWVRITMVVGGSRR